MLKWLMGVALASVTWALTPEQVVVVYNADTPLSTRMAKRYAAVRQIPEVNLVGLRGLKRGVISRQHFDKKMVEPLMLHAASMGWRYPAAKPVGDKPIYAMVLMPDLPIRVGKAPAPAGKIPAGLPAGVAHNGASPDSELALLGARYPLEGALNNPVFNKEKRFYQSAPAVLSVCRIDGPDEETICRLIDDPARVERQGLWGWTVVDNGGPHKAGDPWFEEAASLAKRAWQPLFYEESRKTIAASFPMMERVAVYLGWYSVTVNGPFAAKAPATFRFEPGAIAFHLFSYSCPTLHRKTDWVPALLLRGAAVSAGNVDEPYLHMTIRPDIFYNRLLRGYTVAEAALMATPILSWQGVVIGDPLYRPFAARMQNRVPKNNPFVDWALMLAECRGNYDLITKRLPKMLSSQHGSLYAEMFAWYCLENGAPGKSVEYFRMAMNGATSVAGKLRNRLLYISALFAKGETNEAQELMRRCLDETLRSPYRSAVEATADVVLKEERTRNKPAQ